MCPARPRVTRSPAHARDQWRVTVLLALVMTVGAGHAHGGQPCQMLLDRTVAQIEAHDVDACGKRLVEHSRVVACRTEGGQGSALLSTGRWIHGELVDESVGGTEVLPGVAARHDD